MFYVPFSIVMIAQSEKTYYYYTCMYYLFCTHYTYFMFYCCHFKYSVCFLCFMSRCFTLVCRKIAQMSECYQIHM